MVIVPLVEPVLTVIAASAAFEFAIVPVNEICVLPPVKLYPKPAVRPVVVGRAKVVPDGGSTKPTDTFKVSPALKFERTKFPGSWPAVFKEKLGAGGAVIVAVATAFAEPS